MLNLTANFKDFLCQYVCAFDGPGRLFWLSLLWFGMEFITRLIAHHNAPAAEKEQVKSEDRGSWWLIALSSSLMAAIILSIIYLKWQPDLPAYLIPIGIALMCLGILLRMWAVITLGKFFTLDVNIFSNHRIIQTGPYRWIQHPSYTGAFITTVGFGVASGYLAVLITFLVILGCAQGYRIYVEEKALKEKFGDLWTAYAAKTWKVLPWIW